MRLTTSGTIRSRPGEQMFVMKGEVEVDDDERAVVIKFGLDQHRLMIGVSESFTDIEEAVDFEDELSLEATALAYVIQRLRSPTWHDRASSFQDFDTSPPRY